MFLGLNLIMALIALGLACLLYVPFAKRYALAFFGFCWWRAYWVSNALVAVLLGLVLYIAHIHNQSPVPALLWLAALAIIVALLFLRRALKWRYPV
ncbi:hypothetical protein N2603_36280 [Bradyrhizobium huanghuaihaiense]|uniref:hypothetical protein n=1 Tax=Bradyrhizobium huanghuaihaiense TaxID=990078 RepID=UPI0021AAC398|nr:hypothetical protein [Bradyrhizobium sp. CB3035]UWU75444.1 hypothetical protein N2603_36280 [Bradyrhizobium sp. CB3035]